MKNYKDQFVFKIKRHFLEVLKTKTSDHSVAMGFAIGSFVAILPTPGISFLIGLAIVALFKTINKYALFFAMLVWNIWTLAPIYWASYEIGEAIFGKADVIKFEVDEWDQVFDYTLRFLVGNLFLALPISTISYFGVRWMVRKWRVKRHR
ncbi:DUF2062 domain-containing protein [Reichenbachiella carrageenanivorans]|uniref:DUF2062 domain-containing protein n=1 Tax=Reichenbachiella carrageenanivorans TaxID=2979869 RepID=A0ABY6D4I0_9BACT|nr:DUF2062 domain-containing protein [Reichenbachiella carrageenanivorans]UXX81061.1 DUF2062 domain-containing protein [Reichenbachiella carrageenanivorans]